MESKKAELIMTTMRDEIKEIVKEALKEVLAENKVFFGGVDLAVPTGTPSDRVAKNAFVEKAVAKETKKEEKKEEVATDSSARKAELQAMKYNEIKALVSSLGGKAIGSKDALIDIILEIEGGSSDGEDAENEIDEEDESGDDSTNASGDSADDSESEEESGDSEEDAEAGFIEYLKGLKREEIEEIADECGVKYNSKTKTDALIEKCVADLEKLEEALTVLGYYDEGSEEEEEKADSEESEDDGEEDIATQLGLNDMEVEELADILAQNELSTKGKKQALIDRIVKAVEDGTIELADDGEEEASAPEPKEAPKKEEKKAKPVKKVESKRDTAEAGIEKEIRASYASKKLKDAVIAKFIKPYMDGKKELGKEEALEKYIEIKKAFVDDDGAVLGEEDAYVRDNEYHCCGTALKKLDNGNVYCEICGAEYQM